MNNIRLMLRKLIEEEEGISVRKVEDAIGFTHGTLYRSLGKGGNPEARTIQKILDYLGYEIRFVKVKALPKETEKKGGEAVSHNRLRAKERR